MRMKKVFDFKTFISLALDIKALPNELFIGSLDDFLTPLKNLTGGKVKVFMPEKDFKKVGAPLFDKIKSFKSDATLTIVSDSDLTYSAIKQAIDNKTDISIAVGDKYLLSAVRYYSSLSKIPCVAIVTSPSFDKVFSDNVYLKRNGEVEICLAKKFEKVLVDESLILKSRSENFAEAYACSVKKLTSLIDYKMGCFLSGASVDEGVFSLVKKAVNVCLSAPSYENGKSAIIASQTLLSIVNEKTPAIINSGAETLVFALSKCAPESKDCKKEIISFEKVLKLYHAFFSNDFSSLLSTPEYFLDIEKLQKDFNISKEFLLGNLKIPSEKRRLLINLLIDKTRDDFLSETTAILKAFYKIKKYYSSLTGVMGDGNISYKQIKNAVTLSPYLTDKTSVLTLMRDLGVLSCAN